MFVVGRSALLRCVGFLPSKTTNTYSLTSVHHEPLSHYYNVVSVIIMIIIRITITVIIITKIIKRQ